MGLYYAFIESDTVDTELEPLSTVTSLLAGYKSVGLDRLA